MDLMPLRLNSSSLACSICALAAIILQLVAMECQKHHIVDSPIDLVDITEKLEGLQDNNMKLF